MVYGVTLVIFPSAIPSFVFHLEFVQLTPENITSWLWLVYFVQNWVFTFHFAFWRIVFSHLTQFIRTPCGEPVRPAIPYFIGFYFEKYWIDSWLVVAICTCSHGTYLPIFWPRCGSRKSNRRLAGDIILYLIGHCDQLTIIDSFIFVLTILNSTGIAVIARSDDILLLVSCC